MMLRHLRLDTYADKIEKAILSVIAEGKVRALTRFIESNIEMRADHHGRPGRQEHVLGLHRRRVRPHPVDTQLIRIARTRCEGSLQGTSHIQAANAPLVALAGEGGHHHGGAGSSETAMSSYVQSANLEAVPGAGNWFLAN